MRRLRMRAAINCGPSQQGALLKFRMFGVPRKIESNRENIPPIIESKGIPFLSLEITESFVDIVDMWVVPIQFMNNIVLKSLDSIQD